MSAASEEPIKAASVYRRHPNPPHVQEAFVYKNRVPAAEEKDSSCMCLNTMVSARTLLLAVTCCYAYLWLVRAEDSSLETRSLDFTVKAQQEKDLIDALQEVLEKLRSKEMPLEKKHGWLPSCDAGEPCAVRKGARIGTLCSCARGTSCNFYVLKCL